MAERVVRHRSKTPLMEEFGVDREIKSTLSRRVDLPSGGYLVFDYAEAFTVIDVNTGRFVGSRSKSSTQTLEDTITKNNIEAVKEVVRQLRLRDIGGIIVIDFIDMANPKNRANVEEALRQELERDRTKTYVVEISPLGLVEMTRQNVTDGPREILAKKCPVCAGDGIVVSEQTAAVELEQRLRTLVKGSRSKVYRVEVNAHVASVLIGPGATRLAALEEVTKRRFVVEGRDDVPHDHLEVLAHGATAEPEPGPVAEGADVSLKLVEIGRYDAHAGVGKVDGLAVVVAGGSNLIGKKVTARLERVMNGVAWATLRLARAAHRRSDHRGERGRAADALAAPDACDGIGGVACRRGCGGRRGKRRLSPTTLSTRSRPTRRLSPPRRSSTVSSLRPRGPRPRRRRGAEHAAVATGARSRRPA